MSNYIDNGHTGFHIEQQFSYIHLPKQKYPSRNHPFLFLERNWRFPFVFPPNYHLEYETTQYQLAVLFHGKILVFLQI